jgi:hypothetical protein
MLRIVEVLITHTRVYGIYLLRKRKKVKYGKPYIINAKRPDDAEKI